MDLLKIFKKYNTVKLNCKAKDWKEAIYLTIKPFIDKNLVTKEYYNAIIDNTNKYGPYYIITEKVAMPHAQNENNNVLENCFSLITLQEPIYFENSDKPISILIGLASINSDIHTSKALPQIMAIFENPQIVNKIEKLQLVEDFFKLIESIEIDKYIKKDK